MQRFKLVIVVAAFAALGAASIAVAATVTGTPGPDTLVGTGQNDTINGLAGDDTITGLAGNDKIDGGADDDTIQGDGVCPPSPNPYNCQSGGAGKDKISGGAGNDTIAARDGSRDTIKCGSGRHDLVIADRRDRVASDCERVRRG